MIIGKLGFGKDDFFYGMELCLHKAGRTAFAVTPQTAAVVDVLLVTMFWYRDVYNYEHFRRQAGIQKGSRKPVVIAGGMQVTATPELISQFVDYVFIGDADDDLAKIIEQLEKGEEPVSPFLLTEAATSIPLPAERDPIPFAMSKGGRKDVVRIEIARGCKYRCNFCMLAHLKPYREVAAEDIIKLLQEHPGKSVSCFAPDRTSHSQWDEICAALKRLKKNDVSQDSRLEKIDQVVGSSVTFGLEGMSYRLRKGVRKGYKNEFVLEMMEKFLTRPDVRIGRIAVYFIADLPGESEEDFVELVNLFQEIEKADWSRRLVLTPILNPLSPKKFTDYHGLTIHPFRPYGERWNEVLRKGGGQWGFRIVETLVWGPYKRVADVIVQNGGAAAAALIKELPDKFFTSSPPLARQEELAWKLYDRAVSHYQLPLNASLQKDWEGVDFQGAVQEAKDRAADARKLSAKWRHFESEKEEALPLLAVKNEQKLN